MILGGREVALNDASKVTRVLDPEVGGLVLRPGVHKNLRRRSFAPRAITIHWVGSENFPVRAADPTGKAKWSVLDTLLQRKLGYDFIIDSALTPERRGIYQLADPINTRTPHASIANDQSLAIAVISRGFATKADMRGSDLLDRDELDWNEPRDVFEAVLDGDRTNLVSLHPDALHDLLWLVETLCGLLQIPRRIPTASFMTPADAEAYCKAFLQGEVGPVEHAGSWHAPLLNRDTAPWGRAREFEGVLGHFHVHADKWDPGPQPFYALWREGFNPLGVKLPR